jgi:hypothetical protein
MTLDEQISTYFSTYNNIISTVYINILKNESTEFKYLDSFGQIKTPCYRTKLYSFLKSLIIKKIPFLHQTQLNLIFEILEEDSIEKTSENLIFQINSPDFYSIDDIIDIVYPTFEYKQNKIYQELKILSDNKIPIYSVQYYDNKLFMKKSLGKHNYYFYFSFGTLKNIEQIDWDSSLNIYIKKIIDLLSDPNTDKLILAGHSMGAIIIQHLAKRLIDLNIDLSQIYLIGSGCRLNNILDKEYLSSIKNIFESRYYFVSAGYHKDNKIYFDHKDTDTTNKLIEITTNLLVGDYEEIISQNIITSNNINLLETTNSLIKEFIPEPNFILHDFNTYSKLYFAFKNKTIY